MSRNKNYANEMATAGKFIQDHAGDLTLQWFIAGMRENHATLLHSDRWSLWYNWLEAHYPEELTGSLVTGLAYYVED